MFKSLFTLGLLTIPATVLVSVRHLVRRLAHPLAVAAGAVLLAATVSITAWWLGPVGNYVTRELAPSLSLGAPDDRVPSVVWTAIAALSAYSCFVLVLCVVRAIVRLIVGETRSGSQPDVAPRKSARDVVTTFSLLSIGLMFLSGPFRQPIYDRHLLPLVPFVATFVLLEGGLRRFVRDASPLPPPVPWPCSPCWGSSSRRVRPCTTASVGRLPRASWRRESIPCGSTVAWIGSASTRASHNAYSRWRFCKIRGGR